MKTGDLKIVALAGGVGGARLADGLAQVMQPEQLTIVVNTGDDFTHLGLRISPDLDTVCYTLAGLANPETGWGRSNETWRVFEKLEEMGLPDWFKIGDADLATHLVRTLRLNESYTLSQVTQEFCKTWGVHVCVLPMSDDPVNTWVCTDEGDLEFQEYFVHRQCRPVVRGFEFKGIEKAKPAPGVIEAIEQSGVIVFCPSNPWVSIDPILRIPGIKEALRAHPVYAVSPIIGDMTVKGPAARMFIDLGIQPSALAVAKHYGDLIDCLAIDTTDESQVHDINNLGIKTLVTDIMMKDRSDRGRLAGELVDYIISGNQVMQ